MTSDFRKGDRILGRWQGDSLWFPGTVHSVADGKVAIEYDDGTSEIRPLHDVKPLDWAAGSRIQATWSGDGNWYDAWITAVSPDGREYEVRFDDGIREIAPAARCRAE